MNIFVEWMNYQSVPCIKRIAIYIDRCTKTLQSGLPGTKDASEWATPFPSYRWGTIQQYRVLTPSASIHEQYLENQSKSCMETYVRNDEIFFDIHEIFDRYIAHFCELWRHVETHSLQKLVDALSLFNLRTQIDMNYQLLVLDYRYSIISMPCIIHEGHRRISFLAMFDSIRQHVIFISRGHKRLGAIR